MPGKGAGRPITCEFMEYEGRRYTWSTKGYWRCTSYYDRHLLTRRIWERHHGQAVPRGYQIVFADGDKYNVTPENLLCLTRREMQLRRLADPDYAAVAAAYLAYGHLVNGLMEATDPEKKRERYRKAVATRLERGGYEESTQKAMETRRARYGPSGNSDKVLNPKYDAEVRREASRKAWEVRRERYRQKGHIEDT